MTAFFMFSSEGIVLIHKDTSSTFNSVKISTSLAKYVVLSMNIWTGNRAYQAIDFGENKAWVLKWDIFGSEVFVCLMYPTSLMARTSLIDTGLRNIWMEDMFIMTLYKLCILLTNCHGEVVKKLMNNITHMLKDSLENGTFSDSVGAVDELTDLVNNDDEFQEAKYSFESSVIEPLLQDNMYICRPFTDILGLLHTKHFDIRRIIVFYLNAQKDDCVEFELFVAKSQQYDQLPSSLTTEIGHDISVEYLWKEKDEDCYCRISMGNIHVEMIAPISMFVGGFSIGSKSSIHEVISDKECTEIMHRLLRFLSPN